jgi:hypothetical protein
MKSVDHVDHVDTKLLSASVFTSILLLNIILTC